jgi:hypothetical protein
MCMLHPRQWFCPKICRFRLHVTQDEHRLSASDFISGSQTRSVGSFMLQITSSPVYHWRCEIAWGTGMTVACHLSPIPTGKQCGDLLAILVQGTQYVSCFSYCLCVFFKAFTKHTTIQCNRALSLDGIDMKFILHHLNLGKDLFLSNNTASVFCCSCQNSCDD